VPKIDVGMTSKIKLKVCITFNPNVGNMSIRKVEMATAILILFNVPKCGHSKGVFKKQ
jgi:hypothetical protein